MTKKKIILFSSIAIIILAIVLIVVIPKEKTPIEDVPDIKYIITFNINHNKNNYILTIEDGEILSMPDNPFMNGLDFDGWYWDNNTWNNPLTVDSLLNLDKNNRTGNVYAKFNEINFTYNVIENKATITGVIDRTITEINIPNKISGYLVIGINGDVFDDCINLKYNEKDGVQYLGNESNPYFAAIKSKTHEIRQAKIYSTTKLIANCAFYYCHSLTFVSIPDSVISIGIYAFRDCSSLTSISIPDSVTYIGGSAFHDCSSLTSISIPNSVTSIGDWAFKGCTSLTSISIPNSITSIGYGTFSGCSSLTSISIPDSVTYIGGSAFHDCSSLTSISIPDSITNIGYKAFYNCDSLKYNEKEGILYLGNKKNRYLAAMKPKSENIEQAIIYSTTKIIANNAFEYCSSLTSISIPNSVTSIDNGAFSHCSSLTSISIPNSVTYIGGEAFFHCSSLTSISIPNRITSIDYGTFSGCSSLTSISIPNSVTYIGRCAFENCHSLTSISIPNSIISIGYNTFSGCDSLEYNEYDGMLYLGNKKNRYLAAMKPKSENIEQAIIHFTTKLIADGAFEYCSSLTSISIPDSVISIGSFTFYDCSSLTSISIPNNVMSIGTGAFYDCNSLNELIFNDTANWYYTYYYDDIFKNGTKCDLSNPSENAKIFTTEHYRYYWFKKNW